MPDVGTPSLDQLQVFLTVVETGSFAAAGRRLRRATSAVSYTIANLERQLGIVLFDRQRTRKPALTEAGAVLLSKARAVSGGIDDLRASVKGLLSGLEAEVTLVVDVMFPTSRLADAVRAFEAELSDGYFAAARRGSRRSRPARARGYRRHRHRRSGALEHAWN